jgi:hypothetical protein
LKPHCVSATSSEVNARVTWLNAQLPNRRPTVRAAPSSSLREPRTTSACVNPASRTGRSPGSEAMSASMKTIASPAGVRYSDTDRGALAGIPGQPDHLPAGNVGEQVAGEVPGTVGAPVVHHDQLGSRDPPHHRGEAGQRRRQPVRFVVRGDDDADGNKVQGSLQVESEPAKTAAGRDRSSP